MTQNDGQIFIKATSYITTKDEDLPTLNEPFPPIPCLEGNPVELPSLEPSEGLLKLIENRRSIRDFENTAISMIDLTKMLWGIQGVTAIKGAYMLRTVASAGNKHPINTYVVANNVSSLKKGIYLYDRLNDCLLPIRNDSYENEFVTACLDQAMVVESSVTFVWTAATARTTEKYQARGYRYIFLDAGHIGAQLQLICHEMGLGSCNIAAFFDDAMTKFLNIQSEYELPIYMATVGVPKSVNS
jgi:SagB-type dehydrogenase family enzyme